MRCGPYGWLGESRPGRFGCGPRGLASRVGRVGAGSHPARALGIARAAPAGTVPFLGRPGTRGRPATPRGRETRTGREGRTGGTTTTAGEVVRAAAPLTSSSIDARFRIAAARLFPEAAQR